MKDFLLAGFRRLRKLAAEKDCLSWKGPTDWEGNAKT